jgi:acyl-CoA synthetase (AMP-forming)/AMP-acid ligase II
MSVDRLPLKFVLNESESLQRHFLEPLRQTPQSNAIAYFDGKNFSWDTYESLYRRVAVRVEQLRAAGLQAGEICTIVLPSDLNCAEAILGVLLSNALPLLVAPPFLQKENSVLSRVLEHVIRTSGCRMVVCSQESPSLAESIGSIAENLTVVPWGDPVPDPPREETALANLLADNHNANPDELVGLQLTSGTTNMPKICMWKQSHVLAALKNMGTAMQVDSNDIMHNWTPFYHDMGLVNNLYFCLSHGVPMVVQSPHHFIRKPASWLHALTATGATLTWSPNFGFELVATRASDDELEGIRLDAVRGFYNAAEKIHVETYQRFLRRFESHGLRPEALKTNFGCAEVVGGVTFTEPGRAYRAEWVDRRTLLDEGRAVVLDWRDEKAMAVAGCGIPAENVTIRILDEHGQPVEDGIVGEIAIDTPSHFEGYLANGEATARALEGTVVRMGDVGYLRDGELFWVGRSDERITLLGKKFDPSDFEIIVNGIRGLRPGSFAAFCPESPDDDAPGVVLLCELSDKIERPRAEINNALRRDVSQLLGVPLKEVLLLKPGTLTKTSSGKRRHLHFRKLYEQQGPEAFAHTLAEDETPRP